MRIRIVPSDQETLEEKKKRKQQKGKKRAKKVAKRKTKKKGKDDRCTRIAKRKYDVWPSAYASGAVVKCRQGKIWKGISEGKEEEALERAEEEVLDTLEDEGGAAGLEPLEKALSDNEDLPDDFDIEEFLADLSDEEVQKHDDGDYIEMGGLDEGEVIGFPTKERSSETFDLVNQLYLDYSELQDVHNKNEIGAVLLLNIRQLTEEEREKLTFREELDELESKYGEITDYLQKALEAGVIKLREAKKKRKKAGTESSKESSLHDWFKRRGAKGKKGGWVDCNTCRKDKKTGKKKCKPCGRQKGEKRSKYPACRPTPGACGERGRGKSWGKKSKKKKMKESAGEYVYGVKNPGRVANIYTIKVVKK